MRRSFKYNILKTKSDYPMPLIVEGDIQEETLKNINKSKEWLVNKIHSKGMLINNIFYCFYKNNKVYIITKEK